MASASAGVVIAVVMALAVTSAISGVGKGVKLLSEINLCLAIALLVFVLATGPTLHLLAAFSENIGTYASNILQLSFKTYTYEHEHTECRPALGLLVGGVNGQSRGVRIVIRHGLFSCVYKVSADAADAAASARPVFWARSFSEVLGVRTGP